MQNLITSYFSIFPFSFGAVEDVDPWQLIFIFNFSIFFQEPFALTHLNRKLTLEPKVCLSHFSDLYTS